MFRVLLVDDEIFTIRMLQNLLEWEAMGISLTGFARNGKEAYEMVLKDAPDIIISDIRMPVLNGLELVRKVNDFNDRIKFIIMSAYEDTDYLREAMKLGCCDYIIKPIDEYELEETLRSVIKKIQGENEKELAITRSAKQLDNMNLYHYMKTGRGWKKKTTTEQNNWLNQEPYCVFMIRINNESINDYINSSQMEWLRMGYISGIMQEAVRNISEKHLLFDFEEDTWIAAVNQSSVADKVRTADNIVKRLEQETGFPVRVCFSQTGHGLEELPKLYEEAASLGKYSFYVGEERILGYGYNCNKKEFDEVRNIGRGRDIDQAVRLADWSMLKSVLEEAFNLSDGYHPAELESIYELSYQAILAIRKNMDEEMAGSELYKKDLSISYEKLRAIPSLQQLKDRMWDIIGAMGRLKSDIEDRRYSKPVEESLGIIEQNYNTNLSLDDICSKISVSKNYFCYLFKREVGISIWNYLTDVRIAHAKNLLEETELKSYEIAFRVGYDNPSYFSRLFKKNESMSPNEYREKMKKERK